MDVAEGAYAYYKTEFEQLYGDKVFVELSGPIVPYTDASNVMLLL